MKHTKILVLAVLMLLVADAGLSQTLPTGSVPAGFQVFSTTEVLTNKVWIDNKLIYRKVVYLGNLPNATSKFIAHGLSNVTFVSVTGIGYGSNAFGTYSFNLPFAYTSPYEISLQIASDNIELKTSSSAFTSYTAYAILEYTKN